MRRSKRENIAVDRPRIVRGLYDRHIYQNHEHWHYWVQRMTTGDGDVGYSVYREWPLSVPGYIVKTFDNYEAAKDYINGIWSDIR